MIARIVRPGSLQAKLLAVLKDLPKGNWYGGEDLADRIGEDQDTSSIRTALWGLQCKGFVESKKGPGGGYRLRTNR